MAGESASFDGQDDANASFIKNQEHGGKRLSEKIAGMIENLDPLPASSRKRCCIYKVSDHISKSNELEAYTPQVISIGPIHRNNPELQKMQSFKLRYLKNFNCRAETKLEDIVNTIKGAEESVRECYLETIPLGSSDEFVEMILVDASFIIEYFWKNMTKGNWTDYDKEILKPWLCNRMQMDLILLENQLPFFIIDIIYETAFPSDSKKHPFIELSFSQFEYYNVQKFDHKTFVHLDPDRDSGSSGLCILHFTDLVRIFCMPPCERWRPERSSQYMMGMYSAAQLDEVGLKFKKRESSNNKLSPLELKYHANGVLEIPPFQLDSTTEIYARNLVAFEECHYREDPYITDYYIMLSMLIKTVKDMDVLVRKQIIDNWLDGVVATAIINKLFGEKHFYFQMNSDYHEMAKALNEHCNNPKPIPFIRALLRTSLSRAIAISGSFLLFLTLVQCVCSVLSLKSVF